LRVVIELAHEHGVVEVIEEDQRALREPEATARSARAFAYVRSTAPFGRTTQPHVSAIATTATFEPLTAA